EATNKPVPIEPPMAIIARWRDFNSRRSLPLPVTTFDMDKPVGSNFLKRRSVMGWGHESKGAGTLGKGPVRHTGGNFCQQGTLAAKFAIIRKAIRKGHECYGVSRCPNVSAEFVARARGGGTYCGGAERRPCGRAGARNHP